MWGFAWMVWLVPFLFFLMVTRHWRRERWARAGYAGSSRLERELDQQRTYVDALERRIADLEERLDFTERLLSERAAGAT
ncbi:MAG TPA: hypothetical protein VH680_02800 [Gemmatimonadales bacterium]|jgi:hypothetical protein